MIEFVIGAVVIVILAAVGLFLIARWQRKWLQKWQELEITNQGNVPSRYELRAEDPDGDLLFHFALDGDSLPERQVFTSTRAPAEGTTRPAASPRPAASQAGVQQRARQAMNSGSLLADFLSTLGTFLPASIGSPFRRMASQMRSGQSRVRRVEQIKGQASRIGSRATSSKRGTSPRAARRQAEPAVEAGAPIWVETPNVEPGHSLAVELQVKAAGSSPGGYRPFQVISRSVAMDGAPLVVIEGKAHLAGGFWARRFLPYALIVALSVALLILTFWLASAGYLG